MIHFIVFAVVVALDVELQVTRGGVEQNDNDEGGVAGNWSWFGGSLYGVVDDRGQRTAAG